MILWNKGQLSLKDGLIDFPAHCREVWNKLSLWSFPAMQIYGFLFIYLIYTLPISSSSDCRCLSTSYSVDLWQTFGSEPDHEGNCFTYSIHTQSCICVQKNTDVDFPYFKGWEHSKEEKHDSVIVQLCRSTLSQAVEVLWLSFLRSFPSLNIGLENQAEGTQGQLNNCTLHTFC